MLFSVHFMMMIYIKIGEESEERRRDRTRSVRAAAAASSSSIKEEARSPGGLAFIGQSVRHMRLYDDPNNWPDFRSI